MTYSSIARQESTSEALWLIAFCVVAVFLHIFVAMTLYCGSSVWAWSQKPMIDPDNVMEVSMVILPKSTSRMVQRNTRKKTSSGNTKAKNKAPIPPRDSDLVMKTKETKQNQGAPDRSEDMKRLVDMAQLLSHIDAPEASQDSSASDPNSESTEQVNIGQTGALADPELARYIQKIRDLFHKNFSPLPTIVSANPNIECTIHVAIDLNTGRVKSVKTHRSSGNASYDGAALRAVEAVSSVPLPPEQFKNYFADGYLMVFP